MLVARIDLDDPSHVRQAEKFLGPLPSAPKLSESQKAKVHQVKPHVILPLISLSLGVNLRHTQSSRVCVCVSTEVPAGGDDAAARDGRLRHAGTFLFRLSGRNPLFFPLWTHRPRPPTHGDAGGLYLEPLSRAEKKYICWLHGKTDISR